MATIRKYTSPTQQLIIDGIDLTDKSVYVTYSQDNTKLTYHDEDIEVEKIVQDDLTSTIISIYMSQEDTSKFNVIKDAEVQVNWLDSDGKRNATSIAKIKINRNLLEEVIEENE